MNCFSRQLLVVETPRPGLLVVENVIRGTEAEQTLDVDVRPSGDVRSARQRRRVGRWVGALDEDANKTKAGSGWNVFGKSVGSFSSLRLCPAGFWCPHPISPNTLISCATTSPDRSELIYK